MQLASSCTKLEVFHLTHFPYLNDSVVMELLAACGPRLMVGVFLMITSLMFLMPSQQQWTEFSSRGETQKLVVDHCGVSAESLEHIAAMCPVRAQLPPA